ncbi:MAG: hypothetical protein AMXMBFR37_05990 [Steroidobacteraceae bacterium]
MRGPGGKLPGYRGGNPPGPDTGDEDAPAPFSLRLTFEERASLEQAAGDMPLGAYIRSQVFRGKKTRRRRRYRRPVKDHQALGALLGALGEARLANNLNQLAKAANTGSLPVTPETEKAIREACAEIHAMRKQLMQALGFAPEGSKRR